MTVVFLDVGQGDAAYGRTPGGGHLLVDAGPAHPGAGRDAPVPAFLRAWGVDALDTVVVSHPHADHFGGLADLVAARVPVTEIVAGAPPGDGGADEGYDAVLETMEEAGTRLRGPPACGPLRLAGTTARVVHPCGDVAGLDANDLSLTMLICHREVCVLFTGDIGRRVEGRLARMDEVQRASLLKVPHHGSRYSTSRALASLERLRWAVVSCRAGNSHGFPHPEPMKRLSGAGVRVLRIDRRGAWIAVTDGRSLALFDHRWRRP
jgi:competence protein ComEC